MRAIFFRAMVVTFPFEGLAGGPATIINHFEPLAARSRRQRHHLAASLSSGF